MIKFGFGRKRLERVQGIFNEYLKEHYEKKLNVREFSILVQAKAGADVEDGSEKVLSEVSDESGKDGISEESKRSQGKTDHNHRCIIHNLCDDLHGVDHQREDEWNESA